MMIRMFVVALMLLPSPAFAADVFLSINNESSQIAAINTYPIDADGDPVEDNIGAYSDIMPGTEGRYRLDSGRCGPVLVTVIMADGRELQTRLDLCKRQTLQITD